jgi:ribosomal protein L29
MKKITATTEKELLAIVTEKREALHKLNFGVAKKSKNVKEGRGLRKEVARALTKLGELKRAAAK